MTTTSATVIDDNNQYSWDSIETYYDTSGQIADRVTVYDNGVEKTDFYSDGVRTQTVKDDVLDNVSWDSIVFNYDDNGNIANATTLYDNGTSRQALYEDGALSLVVRLDADDGMDGVFNWAAKMDAYAPDGSLLISATELDDGDEIYLLYQEGEQQTRIENDVDGSDPWLMEVTEYGGAEPVITQYDDYDDIPDAYLEFSQC